MTLFGSGPMYPGKLKRPSSGCFSSSRRSPSCFFCEECVNQVLPLRRARPPVDVDANRLVGARGDVAHAERPAVDGHFVGGARLDRLSRPGDGAPHHGYCQEARHDLPDDPASHVDAPFRGVRCTRLRDRWRSRGPPDKPLRNAKLESQACSHAPSRRTGADHNVR